MKIKKITLQEGNIDEQSYAYYVNEDNVLMSDHRFNYDDSVLLKRLEDKRKGYMPVENLDDFLKAYKFARD